ncbi:MAG: hypothetical protein GY729_01620 [Desulfobacteraceae bacterium]|nr:hypothetical protein [Desulfobacteraceae bacterium]
MPGKNLKEMSKFGDWLEQFLNPKITPRDYRELAEKAINLYSLEYKIESDDISLQMAELINKDFDLNLLDKKLYELTKTLQPPEDLIDDIPFIDDEIEAKEKLANSIGGLWWNSAKFSYEIIYRSRAYTLHLFRTIPATNIWESDFREARYQGHDEIKQSAVNFLTKAYSGLIDKINFGNKKLQFVKSLNQGLISKDYILKPFFPWEVVTSRIFFDFLSLGGQDHFMFCNHCGRFTVIKRRDSKKYCSDICRTASKKNQI